MPAKKKRTRSAEPQRVRKLPTVTLRKTALDALMLLAEGDIEPYVQKAESWRRRMEAAEELLKSGEETMREHAAVVAELNEKLVAAEEALDAAQMLVQVQSDTIARHVPELAEVMKQLVAEKRELEFWVEESDHFRNQVVELVRERAVEQAKRGVDS